MFIQLYYELNFNFFLLGFLIVGGKWGNPLGYTIDFLIFPLGLLNLSTERRYGG